LIPEEKISEIRERTDLLALVKDYIALKRSGASYKGLCPFHGEKSPSFYVHPDRGFYHCFGCQASGDAITFYMRIEGLSFPEAARTLAERAGIEIVAVDDEAERAARQARAVRERLLSIVDAAAGFFVKMLSEHSFGGMARAELDKRCISSETAAHFRLGYAPHGWDELASFLGQRGHSPIDCEKVGLLVPRKQGSGHYDRFRHRLMFPVSDPHGRIVAFSGRALAPVPGDDVLREEPAKYVNSPETVLYKKGDILFGLHEARVALRRDDVALLCEGNFDVLALSQAGLANVVAPLGTAFTLSQAKLLRRYAASVVLLFDSDAAGKKAVRAAQPLLSEAGLPARVVTMPPGDDPDSFIRGRGAESMKRLVESAPSMVEYLIEAAASEAGSDPHAKAAAIEALGPVLASVENPVEARLYVERIAQVFELRDVAAVGQQLRRGVRADRADRAVRPSKDSAKRDDVAPAPRRRRGPLPDAELRLVGAFVDQPSLHHSECAQKVHGLLTSADLRAIFSLTTRWAGSREDASAWLQALAESGVLGEDGLGENGVLGEGKQLEDDTAREWLERRLVAPTFVDEASARQEVELVSAKLELDRAKRDRGRLEQEIRDARRAGDDARVFDLLRQMTELDRFRAAARRGTVGKR
jgi:DNA primase